MTATTRRDVLATAFYRSALAIAFLLSAMLFAAAGLGGFDIGSPWSLWGLVLFANPFVAVAVRHLYRAVFGKSRNLMFLAAAVIGIVGLHVGLMLYLNP